MLKEQYEFIRLCYIELQYNSVYPFINKLELFNFCDRSKLIDDKLNMSNCDLLFVASTTAKFPTIKQKTGIIRCELLEYIVRLANFKYVQNKTVDSFYEAVRITLCDYVRPNYMPQSWQPFRDEELWTIPVNDVLEINLDGINKLHQSYFTPTQKYMSA